MAQTLVRLDLMLCQSLTEPRYPFSCVRCCHPSFRLDRALRLRPHVSFYAGFGALAHSAPAEVCGYRCINRQKAQQKGLRMGHDCCALSSVLEGNEDRWWVYCSFCHLQTSTRASSEALTLFRPTIQPGQKANRLPLSMSCLYYTKQWTYFAAVPRY